MDSNATNAAAATHEAKKKLIDLHKQEFLTLLGDAREARGLSRVQHGETREQILGKIAKEEKRLADLRAKLETV